VRARGGPKHVPQAYFVETFDDASWADRWVKSAGTKLVNDKEVLAFDGAWEVELPTHRPTNASTPALTVKTAARHHGISARLPAPIDAAAHPERSLVLQYAAPHRCPQPHSTA
jgi:calnexin